MIGLPKKVARRWYAAGIILSVLAIIAVLFSHSDPRLGYPLAFVFTMFGILSVTRPNWEWPERRPGLVIANSSVFLTQIAILLIGMNSGS